MSTSARVIKNTGYLYLKMGITVFVSFYSTRLILASLGASDFGIYHVVGGAIAMLGFLNSTLANATQRFMSYAEGEGVLESKRRIFNVSVVLHLIIAVATILILLIAMPILFNGVFNIEPGRETAAQMVYYCLILSTVLTIINVPYDAVMNAHENMRYYSIIGIFEALLRLGIAFACVYTSRDKLMVYSFLMVCVPLITLSIMKVYCHRHYDECIIAPKKYWDSPLIMKIGGFFGWNFLTAISSLFSAQGIGIVLNHFFGSVLNAAQGIAQQVNGAVSHFSGNMMKALNPVIVKNAGAKNVEAMNRATIVGCKYSALLTMVFAIPLSLEINYVLNIWLKDVPEWATFFCVMQLIQGVLLQMTNSASTAIYAQGDIKEYAIWKSVMNSMPVILTWLAFRMGGGPLWLYIPMIAFWAVGGDIVIVYYAKIKCNLEIKNYVVQVLIPLLGTAFLMFACGIASISILKPGIGRLIITCVATTLGLLIAGYTFAISEDEKVQLLSFLNHLFNRKKEK